MARRERSGLMRLLGPRLKRAVGFGLMVGTAAALFWYVMRVMGRAEAPFAGTLVFWVAAVAVTGAVAYATLFKSLPRR